MSINNREDLQNLSTQFLEIFIQDILVKNQVNTASVKDSMTEEQRQKLKKTVDNLKEQVEDFLKSETIVTQDMTKVDKKQTASSPLRESLRQKEQAEDEPDTTKN